MSTIKSNSSSTVGLKRQMNECIDSAYIKGFKDGFDDGRESATYDDKSLDEIKQDERDEGYGKGLDDAQHALAVLIKMSERQRSEEFLDCSTVDEVITGFTVRRIVEVVRNFEDDMKKIKERSIKVGDVVKSRSNGTRMVVTRVDAGGRISGVCKNGEYFNRDPEGWDATGEHFDEIDNIFDLIAEDE